MNDTLGYVFAISSCNLSTPALGSPLAQRYICIERVAAALRLLW
jgi:hypothetical protein